MSLPNGVTLLSSAIRCTQDTQYMAGVGCDRTIMEYAHDEYCDMLLILSTCNSRSGTVAREYELHYPGRRHPDAVSTIGAVSPETESVIATTHVDAGRPRTIRTPAKEDAIIAAVEWEARRGSSDIARELNLSQSRVFEVLHDHQLHPYH
jgi:hypothetical protein